MKNTFRRVGAMFATAIMTVASFAMTMTSASASESNPTLSLTGGSGVAGQMVTVGVVLDTDDTCTAYNFDITFDEDLEFKGVSGVMASEVNDNVVTVVNLTGTTFLDDRPVTALTFMIPEDAPEGATYDLEITRIGNFGCDNGEYENPVIEGTTISVLESMKKVTTYLVFVTQESGVDVSIVGLRGDADCDGNVGLYDAIRISESLVKKNRSLDAAGAFFADVDGNGQCNIYDAILICQYMLSSDKSTAWETMF